MELQNRLSESKSPYLLEAAHQPVHWQPYTDEVFKIARELDRPILLDIGAVWCHWCHVMDNESYSDESVAEIINSRFVPVKVDRDQMPDVDSRYQAAIGAITGNGGWPLTGFLTSDGKVFFGGTYFPKDDVPAGAIGEGRQGLLALLPRVAEAYSKRREDVLRSADELFQQLSNYETQTIQPGELNEQIIRTVIDNVRSRFDDKFGGFGSAPKFFNATALQLITEEAMRQKDSGLRAIAELTLNCIANGGVYDQVGGGFHRYSVDRYWHVPHFEKMVYDNSLMLRVYLQGYLLTRNDLYTTIARETGDWITNVMRSSEGAFYAHQDADVGVHDDGTYWTWTAKEVEAALTRDERKITELYFDVREKPEDISEFPERNVLRVSVDKKEIAKDLGKWEDDVEKLIASARQKMLVIRNFRKMPFIDKTVFADRNGLVISALVEASLELQERKYLKFAEDAADFVLGKMTGTEGKIAHAFSGQSMIYSGLLDDQVFFGIALLDLFDVMRNDIHIDAAEKIAQVLLNEFEDREGGGFFDRPSNAGEEGLLITKRKPIDDTPTPSGNSAAAIFFDRLFSVTENKEYYEVSDRTLKAFAGSVDKLGIYASNYARALRYHFNLSKSVR